MVGARRQLVGQGDVREVLEGAGHGTVKVGAAPVTSGRPR